MVTTPRLYGADIKGLQEHLAKLGYDPGPIDGFYGPITAAAVKEFQRRNNLPADGIVQAGTWAALGRQPSRPEPAKPAAPTALVIDAHLALLAVVEEGRVIATFPVALGKIGTPTPIGTYRITFKASWSGGFGTRFLGLSVPWGIFGIHGTNKPWSIGRYESHGCIRMFNRDVEQLSRMVAVGTPVHIIGDPFYGTSQLLPGDKGAPVYYLQRRLGQLGYYRGKADGYYGAQTAQAVKEMQKAKGMAATGRVGWAEIKALRLRATD